MTDSMIELVANAVHAMLEKNGIILVGTDWIPQLGSAAIEAMRAPTEAMVKAGWDAMPDYTQAAPCNAEETWAAMIDAALSEKP